MNSDSEDYKSISKSDLMNILQKHTPVIVLVYKNYCGYCKNMKPEWESFLKK